MDRRPSGYFHYRVKQVLHLNESSSHRIVGPPDGRHCLLVLLVPPIDFASLVPVASEPYNVLLGVRRIAYLAFAGSYEVDEVAADWLWCVVLHYRYQARKCCIRISLFIFPNHRFTTAYLVYI